MSNSKFSKVQGLKWTPWIGNDYFTIPQENRLLIIGESHYHERSEDSSNLINDPNFTIQVIEEMAIDRCYYQTKLFQNLHKALFRNDIFNSGDFWKLVSFYNFIQKPMVTNEERPSYEDFYNSWSTCFEVISILQPTTCLFLGTTAANSFIHAVRNTKFKHEEIMFETAIGNTYPRISKFICKNDFSVELIFIRHCSKMFSWNKWNIYLMQKMGENIGWLENYPK